MSNKKEGPFILGINSSPHKNGHVAKMLRSVLVEAHKKGASTKTINLIEHKILPHSGKLNPKQYIDRINDNMPELQRLVLSADGIVFASPTHWFNVSSLMKLFLDRLTPLEDYNFLLEGKVAGFVIYGPQGGGVNAAMLLSMTVNQMGMVIPPYATIFDEGRRVQDDKWIGKEYAVLAKNMVQQIHAWKTLRLNWGYANAEYEISPIELLRIKSKKKHHENKN